MQDFETEEQQVEALKKWFKENALSLFLGIGIGVGGLIGWRYYIDQQNDHYIQAGEMYRAVSEQAADSTAVDAVADTIEKLVSQYADTPYAALAQLTMASYELDIKDLDSAADRLDWVSQNAVEPEMRHLAGLRLVRVLIAQEKFQDAEKLLQQEHPASFDRQYEELKGDLYVAMGDIDKARQAYDSAIAHAGARVDPLLQLKRHDLGEADSIAVSDTDDSTAQ